MRSPSLPPHPLRFGNFRAYLLGRLTAVLAQYGMMVVLAWQAYNVARETMSTGANTTVNLPCLNGTVRVWT